MDKKTEYFIKKIEWGINDGNYTEAKIYYDILTENLQEGQHGKTVRKFQDLRIRLQRRPLLQHHPDR